MPTTFDPQSYPQPLAELLEAAPLNDLGPGRPNDDVHDALAALDVESAFAGQSVDDCEMAQCCLSGLWLMHDFLDESHHISQSISSREGSYWHGILHRREGDYSNSKYWFRRVGDHPVFEPLADAARELADELGTDERSSFLSVQSPWDPCRLVDLCEEFASGTSHAEELCRRMARTESQLLFDYCYRHAIGDA